MSQSSAAGFAEEIQAQSFFQERDEVLDLLVSLAVVPPAPPVPTTSSAPNPSEQKVERLKTIFDKYLESPTLLDAHLEELMSHLVNPSLKIIHAIYGLPPTAPPDSVPQQLSVLHSLLDVISALCKVRGYKTVKKFFSHEAADLEPMLSCLLSQDRLDHTTWSSRYSLLLWLSMLALVPFDICTIDSSDSSAQQSSSNLVQSIISVATSYLGDAGPPRESAAVCLAAVLTRPDMEKTYLKGFMAFARATLDGRVSGKADVKASHLEDETFKLLGVVATLALLFKTGVREKLLVFVDEFMAQIIMLAESSASQTLLRKLLVKLFQRIGTTFMPPRVVPWRYQRGQRSLLTNMMAKGKAVAVEKDTHGEEEVLSEPHIFVPLELEDVVDQLLTGLRDRDTVVRWSAAKGLGRITERLPRECADDVVGAIMSLLSPAESDSAWHGSCLALAELARRGLLLPGRLQAVVPAVVTAIGYDVRRGQNSVGAHVRDAACYVCWAFARAYSPEIMAPHVDSLAKGMLRTALFDREINCRRAASAAFQENVGRQGNENFQHGIDILTAADYFTLGNRVSAFTDIAYFVAKFDKYKLSIFDHLRTVKLFHWDVEIRELSSVGLGNLVSLDPVYSRDVVLPELIAQVCHSDLLVRHGAVVGVAEVVLALSKCEAVNTFLKLESIESIFNVVVEVEKARLYRGKGGEVMRGGICRLIECISLARLTLPAKHQVRLLDSVDECIKQPLECLQLAAVAALRALANSYFPISSAGPSARLDARIVQKYVTTITTDDNPAATRGFSLALGALPKKLLAYNSEVLLKVVASLCQVASINFKVGLECDAETRKNCLIALTEVVTTVGVGRSAATDIEATDGACRCVGLNSDLVNSLFECFLASMNDYTMDKRGDVGSWVRTAGLAGLEALTFAAVNGSEDIVYNCGDFKDEREGVIVMAPKMSERDALLEPSERLLERAQRSFDDIKSAESREDSRVNYFDQEKCSLVFCAVLKQLSEKLDSMREVAGNVLNRLLERKDVRVPFVADRGLLVEAIRVKEGSMINWASPSVTFPMMTKAMNIDAYHSAIVEGLIISVGGLTESVVKSSSQALLEWARTMKRLNGDSYLAQSGRTFLSLMGKWAKDERVIIPLLKTLHLLFSNDVPLAGSPSADTKQDDNVSGGEGAGGPVPASAQEVFYTTLVSKLKAEADRSKSYAKLMAVAQILIDLIRIDGLQESTFDESLEYVLTLLGHTFPKVRKFVAEQLYLAILENENLVRDSANYDKCCTVLLDTAWEGDLEGDASSGGGEAGARIARNNLADLWGGVTLSAQVREKAIKKVGGKMAKPKDELESYMSLVKEAGR